MTITVPAVVPSLFQRACPLVASPAEKNNSFPNTVRYLGPKLVLDVSVSLIITVPSIVPSVFHNDSPYNEL